MLMPPLSREMNLPQLSSSLRLYFCAPVSGQEYPYPAVSHPSHFLMHARLNGVKLRPLQVCWCGKGKAEKPVGGPKG